MSISRVTKQQLIVNDEELLKEVFNSVGSSILVLDKLGVVVKANKSAFDMFGEPLIEEKWLSIVKKHFAPRKDDGHEVSLKDGRRLLVSTTSLSVGKLVVLTDVTQTRTLQARIGHMERLSSLGKMAASLAHQIRTPLSAAMLYASNLTNKGLTVAMKDNFLKKLTDRLTDLENQVRDILLFARSEDKIADKVTIEELVCNIECNSEGVLNRNNAILDVDLTGTENLEIIANKTALASAISNLVVNALEAGANHLYLSSSRKGSSVILKLADNGKGMSKELVNKIFEPFYTTKSNGTGLGLAVVQSVIRTHMGKIGLVSQEGKGTCFTISIPLHISNRVSNDSSNNNGGITKAA